MKKAKKIIFVGICCLAVVILSAITYLGIQYTKWAEDFSRLKQEEYDTVFFSMYPTEYYEEGDYAYFRGMDVVKTSYAIPHTRIMELYMDVAVKSGNVIHTAYLGIDPQKARTEDIFQIVLENPATMFEIVLAYPKIDYWLAMDEEEYQAALNVYRDLAGNVLGLENVRVYYFCNAEWLLCNPANYVDTFHTNEEVSKLLMCNSDAEHSYILNVNNFHDRFNQAEALVEKYRKEPAEYPDASAWEIVFFGDSVIGNYVDSMSIPGVVSGLTGAAVYNCGYGGKSAALCEGTREPLPVIVDAFLLQDLSKIPKDTQAYAGIRQYLQQEHSGKENLFVINYGLNDYFNGLPVKSGNLYDVASYSGAIRLAVKAIRNAYPEAEILLMTPNRSINFDFGEGIQSEVGGSLQDYADAVLDLAKELKVEALDNFRELPIKKERHWELLVDGTHPNEQGRFLVGTRIAEKIESMIGK